MKIMKWIVLLLTALSLMAAPYQQPKSSSAADKTSTSPASAKLIDLNTATQDELKSLPGIGDAYSAAIIKNRPYANKRQLVSKKGHPASDV